MDKITFVIPSRNNLNLLKLAYTSIRRLKGEHEILVLDDASEDGTGEWLETLNDENSLLSKKLLLFLIEIGELDNKSTGSTVSSGGAKKKKSKRKKSKKKKSKKKNMRRK